MPKGIAACDTQNQNTEDNVEFWVDSTSTSITGVEGADLPYLRTPNSELSELGRLHQEKQAS